MAGGSLVATIALAAADIPTRYVGSFPAFFPTASRFSAFTNITGAFAGKSLSLRYVVIRKSDNKSIAVTAKYTCAVVPPNVTSCAGQFQGNGMSGPAYIQVTWKEGQPVSTHFGKKKG
jgi:hypothetical protein